MRRPAFIIGVYGFAAERRWVREPIASFFDHADAADFAMHPERDGFERRNLYIGVSDYDRRVTGYRPAAKPSGYEDWLLELGTDPQMKRPRIAA